MILIDRCQIGCRLQPIFRKGSFKLKIKSHRLLDKMTKKQPNDQDPANYGQIAVKPMITMVQSIICEYDDDKENDRKATYY